MGSARSPSFPSLHVRHNSFYNPYVALPTSQLILLPFLCFTYVTVHSPTLFRFSYVTSIAHSPTFPSLHLCHSLFSNPSVALPTSQLILQPFRCFTHVIAHSPNPSFASTSQALHLRHLASRPCSSFYCTTVFLFHHINVQYSINFLCQIFFMYPLINDVKS